MGDVIHLPPRPKTYNQVWTCGNCQGQLFHLASTGEIICIACVTPLLDMRVIKIEESEWNNSKPG